jgi:hypothetical protein
MKPQQGSKHKLIYDGMWHFDIPKCRDIDAGKVEVIARNQCGEAYATTTLEITPRCQSHKNFFCLVGDTAAVKSRMSNRGSALVVEYPKVEG